MTQTLKIWNDEEAVRVYPEMRRGGGMQVHEGTARAGDLVWMPTGALHGACVEACVRACELFPSPFLSFPFLY